MTSFAQKDGPKIIYGLDIYAVVVLDVVIKILTILIIALCA